MHVSITDTRHKTSTLVVQQCNKATADRIPLYNEAVHMTSVLKQNCVTKKVNTWP